MRSANATATKVMIRVSIESSQNPRKPNSRNETVTSATLRPPATAYVTHMAMASVPTHPICGTGLGNLPSVNICWSQVIRLLMRSLIQ